MAHDIFLGVPDDVESVEPICCEVCHRDDCSLDTSYLNEEAVCEICGNEYDTSRREDGSCSFCKEHSVAVTECSECGVVYIRDNDNWAVRR